MKTYILQKPKKLVLENLPSVPVRTKDDVKVKIELAAVTNTDLSIFGGKYKTALPLALGRQAVGVVSEALPDNRPRYRARTDDEPRQRRPPWNERRQPSDRPPRHRDTRSRNDRD